MEKIMASSLVRQLNKFIPKKSSKWQAVLLALLLLLIFAPAAQACVEEKAAFLLGIPTAIYSAEFYFYGLPFVLIVFLEAFILSKREHISSLFALILSIIANLFAVFLGFVILFLNLALFLGFVAICLFGADILTNYWKSIDQKRFKISDWFLAVSLPLALISNIIAVGFRNSDNIIVTFILMASLFLAGFVYNFIAKFYILAGCLPKERPTLLETVLSMNLVSYASLILPYYFLMRSQLA
jgi:hypothetical protein